MESSADVLGVDILLFPVEEEEKAPSPSELPMPNFGFQGMDIAGDFQPPTGRDINPNVTNDDPMEDSQDNLTRAYEEVPLLPRAPRLPKYIRMRTAIGRFSCRPSPRLVVALRKDRWV